MRLIDDRRTRRCSSVHGDEGFTLIELVVTVAILGIVMVALFGVLFAYFDTTRVTESRLSESTDQQFVSTYWQADVSALGNRSLNAADTANPVPSAQSVWKAPGSGCGSTVSGGSIVVRFEWKEFAVGADGAQAWLSTNQAAAYVSVPHADGQYSLVRVRCDGGTAEPIMIAHTLTDPPTVQCDGSDTCPTDGSLPAKVTIKLKVRNLSDPDSLGYTTILTGDRRQG